MQMAQRYQSVQKETASKERLMVMLFQAARRHMAAAAKALEHGQPKEARTPLQKAQDIVGELMGSLNPAVAPQLCQSLGEVYAFVLTRLLHATLHHDATAVKEADRAFAPLALAFEEAVAKAALG